MEPLRRIIFFGTQASNIIESFKKIKYNATEVKEEKK